MDDREAPTPDQVRRFADFVEEEWDARKVRDWLSSFEKEPTDHYTYIVRFERQHNLSHPKALSIFKRLQNIGVGFLIVGRHDHPTRFLWRCSMTELAKALNEELGRRESDNQQEELDCKPLHADKTENKEVIEHNFVLRQEYLAKIALPADLTKGEAERLGNWLRTLSFE